MKNRSFKATFLICASALLLVATPILAQPQGVLEPLFMTSQQGPDDDWSKNLQHRSLDFWAPGDKEPLAHRADYSGAKSLAISLSYPLYKDARTPHPASFTGGGAIDVALASDVYKGVKSKARQVAEKFNNYSRPLEDASFANCSAFTAAIIVNTIDPRFPGNLVSRQRRYLESPENGWIKVADGDTYNPSWLEPGDIFISTKLPKRPDHTWMWLGDVDGKKDVIAEASFGREGSAGAHLPALRINPLHGGKKDHRGRNFEVWRHIKNTQSNLEKVKPLHALVPKESNAPTI